jgi:hypothetical protein
VAGDRVRVTGTRVSSGCDAEQHRTASPSVQAEVLQNPQDS